MIGPEYTFSLHYILAVAVHLIYVTYHYCYTCQTYAK